MAETYSLDDVRKMGEQTYSLADVKAMKPAAVEAGQALNDIPRQLGLTARYGLEGLANTTQILTEPIRNALSNLATTTQSDSPLAMNRKAPAIAPLGQGVSSLLDKAGLPSPQTADERAVGDATRLVAGSGGLGAAARTATALPGMAGKAAEFLSANMPQQLSSAAGAGLAGGASREAGGSPLMQGAAALVGGVGAGMVPGAISGTVNAAKNAVFKMTPQQIDAQVSAVLGRSGVDYSQIPERARQVLREQVRDALNTGRELDPAAVRRLADFALVPGATPTRGMVSQNPVQVTREMNLAKIGANSSDEALQGLPLIQNRNNAALITRLNESGAAQGDTFRAGEQALGAINARDAALKSRVTGLYDQARGLYGGDIPIDRKPFIDNVFGALTKENRMAFLPKEIGDTLNAISSGNTPFTPQTVDMLKTMLATAARSSKDGNVQAAVKIARNALEATPLNVVSTGSTLPATAAQSAAINQGGAAANDFMRALDKARNAARGRFAWQESSRPVDAALGGAQPDKFVQQYVIGGSLADARAVAQNAPAAEVKNAILSHLKDKALNGAADEVGRFSQSAYNKALSAIGDRKLALFFSPEEIGQLRAAGRVASYMQTQPVGSAVNNSNSGALLIGKGYDAMKGLLDKIPGGQTFLTQPLTNIEIAIKNRQAQNIAPGLLMRQEPQPLGQGLLLPAIAYSGGLLAP